MLTEELGEAALIHITAMNAIFVKFISRVTAADEGAIGVDAGLNTGIFSFTLVHILARSSIFIEGETRVARTGIGSWNICTELLAVTIATFINV